MPTRDELEKRYAQMQTAQLLDIVEDDSGYTELAIEVAAYELQKRKVSEQQIQQYKIEKKLIVEATIHKHVDVELALWQKVLCYMICVPLFSLPFRMNFKQEGHLLKLRQTWYYNICGLMGILLLGMLSALLHLGDIPALVLWLALFIPTCQMDDRFNRQILLKRFTLK